MKRWAVFEAIDYYPCGGMGDFVGAFDAEAEARAFIESRVDMDHLYVEDMAAFLDQPSPETWSEAKQAVYILQRRISHEEAMKDPFAKAMYDLSCRLQKDFFGDGEDT